MENKFKIINDGVTKPTEYPELPFVIKTESNHYFLVVKDNDNDNNYAYVTLNGVDKGTIISDTQRFKTLDDMFECNPHDKILDVELHIR